MKALLTILSLALTLNYVSACAENTIRYKIILRYTVNSLIFSFTTEQDSIKEKDAIIFSDYSLPGQLTVFQEFYNFAAGGSLWLDSSSIDQNIWLEIYLDNLDIETGTTSNLFGYNRFISLDMIAAAEPDSIFNYNLPDGKCFYFRLEKDSLFHDYIDQLGLDESSLKFYYYVPEGFISEGISTVNSNDYIYFKAENFGKIAGIGNPVSAMWDNSGAGISENNYSLHQNYPNPFNPETKIVYDLPRNGFVKLRVYNVMGELVETLADGFERKGSHEVIFSGGNLSSGLYFYELEAESYRMIKKMILLK